MARLSISDLAQHRVWGHPVTMRALRGAFVGIAVASLTLLGMTAVRADVPELVASLSGAQVVPPSTPLPSGGGSLRIFLGSDPGVICFELRVSNLPDFPPTSGGPSFGAQIHKSVLGASGPAVATFPKPIQSALTTGCISGLSQSRISKLFTDPQQYYVEVDELNPDAAGCGGPSTPCVLGAIRGQLGFAISQVPNTAVAASTSTRPAQDAAVFIGTQFVLATLIMGCGVWLARQRETLRG